MRIISVNVNGIRSAARKGFFDWMKRQRADVICLQETRAQEDQLADPVYRPRGWHVFFHDAVKKGYSGVAVYTRHRPERVIPGIDWEDFDREGRYLQVDFPRLSVISLYMPSGTSGDVRQEVKYRCMDRIMEHLRRLRRNRREYILCGDWNIAHKQIDLRNWRSNQKNSGFLPDERAWMDRLFGEAGFIDAFRVVNQQPDQYTWWSNRGRARENNVGWRIDYQVITPGLADKVQAAAVYRKRWFSDHAPLTIDYDWPLGGP